MCNEQLCRGTSACCSDSLRREVIAFFFFFNTDCRKASDDLADELCAFVVKNYPIDNSALNVELRQFVFRIANYNKLDKKK